MALWGVTLLVGISLVILAMQKFLDNRKTLDNPILSGVFVSGEIDLELEKKFAGKPANEFKQWFSRDLHSLAVTLNSPLFN